MEANPVFQLKLKDQISSADLEKISQKSDWKGFTQFLFHSSCLIVSGVLVKLSLQTNYTILFLLAEILHAYFMSFLFMPLHEAIHNTAFNSAWANKSLAWITGFLTARFPKYYTIYHFPHHRYTGDPKRDPELLDTLIDMKLKTAFSYVVYLSGIPYWIEKVQTSIQLCQGTVLI
jgi:fatty acid desaturase